MGTNNLWREPFVHFFILGVVLFGVDAALRGQPDSGSKDEIVVTAGRVESLAAVFEKTWQRPPTEQELQGLVDSYVLDEALFRQGVELGVDRDDSVIRRRVRQKLDFLIDDLATPAEANEPVLRAWFDENVDDYVLPATYTFIQIYVNPDRHGDALDAKVDSLLTDLRRSGENVDFGAIGDATLLEPSYVDISSHMVANGFGGQFARQLENAPVGTWSGPYESAFGLHLVLMISTTPARVPELAEVREAVARDWRSDQRDIAVAQFHEQTLARFDVTVEWPENSE